MRETINERNVGLEIDLQKLLLTYLRKWWLMLLCGVVVAAGALIYTANFVTPLYRASVTVYVNNVRSDQQVDYLSESNLAASRRLVNTYINIARSDRVLEKVAERLEGEYSAEMLREMLSASQVDETEIFELCITHPEPEEAERVANMLAEVAPEEISALIEGSSARVIDYAKVPEKPYTPSYKKNVFFGAAIGVFLAMVCVTVLHLLDVRIKDEEDLMALVDYPLLGQIPDITLRRMSNKKKYGYEPFAPAGGKGGRR